MRHRLRHILRFLVSRTTIVILMILLQLVFAIILFNALGDYFVTFQFAATFISFLVILFIINKKENPAYKLAWIVPLTLFPIATGLLYLALGGNRSSQSFIKRLNQANEDTAEILNQQDGILEALAQKSKSAAKQSSYLVNGPKFPIYKNTQTTYFSSGEDFFVKLVEELKNAKEYIFMEFFIVEEGLMWDTILAILKMKAAEGLDIRFMYDDLGSLFTLPFRYSTALREFGIKSVAFNHFIPLLSLRHNNRDHRKIVVIDGETAFTGGCNLADEYINAFEKHGKWKDCMIMLKGEAVYSFTIMFLQTWKYFSGNAYEKDKDFYKYKPHEKVISDSAGFVQPYGDSPLDEEATGEIVYLNLINNAQEYIYIMTPYFIVDDTVLSALTVAAESGIDVRIMTPHIPDKAYVHVLTRANYEALTSAGVRVFEYEPGFIHSKTFVVDDEYVTVGTVNLDYRSFYLHFECGAWMYKTNIVADVKADFLATQEICREVTYEDAKNDSFFIRIVRAVLGVFAPLM